MIQATKGIVLNSFDFSETSIIAKIFTEQFGLQSYLINSVRSKKAKFKANLFQPLSLLDLVVYHKENKNLQRLSEAKSAIVFCSIPYDVIKSSLVMFLGEVLYKSIKTELQDEALFQFIFNSVSLLDMEHRNCNNFHLFFLAGLTHFLGIFPSGTYSEDTPFFNLTEGRFFEEDNSISEILDKKNSLLLNKILTSSYEDFFRMEISSADRKQLLLIFIRYFELHLASFTDIRSHEILTEILA